MGSVRIVEEGISKKCSELSYRLIVPTAEFDSDRFAKEFARLSKEDDWKGVVLGPGPDNPSGFHAHVYWRPDRKNAAETQLQVDFHRWKPTRKVSLGIYAENFYSWASQFLKQAKANIHVHAEYVLPRTSWLPKVMPLPMKIPYSGKTAVVDGISIEFSADPAGVHGAWLVLNKKNMTVQLFAFRPIEFSAFEIQADIDAFSSVVKGLVEEKLS
jgi:hypothetical protein